MAGMCVSCLIELAHFLKRMGYVKRKGTTKANTQLPEDKFQRTKASFLHQTVALVKQQAIPSEFNHQP